MRTVNIQQCDNKSTTDVNEGAESIMRSLEFGEAVMQAAVDPVWAKTCPERGKEAGKEKEAC